MRTAWALMATLSISFVPAWADDSEDSAVGEELLPKEVLVFFSTPSVPDCKERMDASLFGQMLKDPDLQPFINGIKEKIEQAAGKMKDEIGVSLDEALEIPQGEITFAVLELPTRKLGLVLMIDYGDNKEAVEKLLSKMEGALKDLGGDVEGEDVDGVNIRTFTFANEGDNPFNKLAYFDHDDYVVLASDPEALKAILERWDGKSDETFAQHDVYRYILEKCSSEDRDPVFKWFINPIGLAQSAVGMMQAQVPQAGLVLGFLPLLGLSNLKGMGGACDVEVEDFDAITKSFFYVEQPTSGILNIFQFPPADLAPPPWVPDDAAMYSGMNWNASGAYSAIETLVDSFQGPGAFGKVVDQLAERENGPGIHLKKDLIDQLAGQIHIVMGATEESDEPTPKMMFALDVKNTSKMNAVLAKAAKSEGFRGQTRDFEGTTIYEIEGVGGGAGASLAVADKHLFISTDTALLENALRPRSNLSPLAADPVYKKLSKKFPKKLSMLGYQNGNSQMQTAYQMVKSGNFPDMPEDFRDILARLPNYEVLKKYLRSSASYTVPDKKGALSVSFTLKEQE
jgi:hypothetical protein